MLISAVMPIMSVYRLPQGQYGYSGHVINLPQDVAAFAQSLPRLPSQLDVIVVRKEGTSQTHRDFRVRRVVVLRALQWLVTNNQYYRALGVTIDTNALEPLPQDENVANLTYVTETNKTAVRALRFLLPGAHKRREDFGVAKPALLLTLLLAETVGS